MSVHEIAWTMGNEQPRGTRSKGAPIFFRRGVPILLAGCENPFSGQQGGDEDSMRAPVEIFEIEMGTSTMGFSQVFFNGTIFQNRNSKKPHHRFLIKPNSGTHNTNKRVFLSSSPEGLRVFLFPGCWSLWGFRGGGEGPQNEALCHPGF